MLSKLSTGKSIEPIRRAWHENAELFLRTVNYFANENGIIYYLALNYGMVIQMVFMQSGKQHHI